MVMNYMNSKNVISDSSRVNYSNRSGVETTFFYPNLEVKIDNVFVTITKTINQPENGDQPPSITYYATLKSKITDNILSLVEISKTYYKESEILKKSQYYEIDECENSIVVLAELTLNCSATFDTIFFPEKALVLKLLDDLANKTIPKLGLYLYGEPGCGKTSIIKSIVNYTGRHVISVALSKVKSKNALMSLFFDEKLYTTQCTRYIPFKDRIYIFEDIDAESDIVLDRKDVKSKDTDETDKKDKTEKKTSENTRKDTLKLSDVLNVLDGVTEITDSIIIITTNHPEKLDPALTRPGRITMAINMGKMLSEDVFSMVSYHYPRDVQNIFEKDDKIITASRLESILQLSKDYQDFVKLYNEFKFSMSIATPDLIKL